MVGAGRSREGFSFHHPAGGAGLRANTSCSLSQINISVRSGGASAGLRCRLPAPGRGRARPPPPPDPFPSPRALRARAALRAEASRSRRPIRPPRGAASIPARAHPPAASRYPGPAVPGWARPRPRSRRPLKVTAARGSPGAPPPLLPEPASGAEPPGARGRRCPLTGGSARGLGPRTAPPPAPGPLRCAGRRRLRHT